MSLQVTTTDIFRVESQPLCADKLSGVLWPQTLHCLFVMYNLFSYSSGKMKQVKVQASRCKAEKRAILLDEMKL